MLEERDRGYEGIRKVSKKKDIEGSWSLYTTISSNDERPP
jgi:hypothetical protein